MSHCVSVRCFQIIIPQFENHSFNFQACGKDYTKGWLKQTCLVGSPSCRRSDKAIRMLMCSWTELLTPSNP